MYYPRPRGSYHEREFLRYVLEYLSSRCPLCGGEHPPKYHTFAGRSYRDSESAPEGKTHILVPRLVCEPNKQRRTQTGELVQYTIRILPGFLIPYSRVVVDAVQEALDSWLSEQAVSQIGAALRMGCLSPLSFRLFYHRVRKRISAWLIVLVELVGELGGEIAEHGGAADHEPLRAQWMWFHLLVAEYLRAYARLPETQPILESMRWQHLYALLSHHQMGLGP